MGTLYIAGCIIGVIVGLIYVAILSRVIYILKTKLEHIFLASD